jgi:hypothetical protein
MARGGTDTDRHDGRTAHVNGERPVEVVQRHVEDGALREAMASYERTHTRADRLLESQR